MILLRRGTHRYDRSLYPKSGLPGFAICAFESEMALIAERGADASIDIDLSDVDATMRSPHEMTTVRYVAEESTT